MIINNLLTNPYSRKSGSQRESGLRRIVCLAALLVCFVCKGWSANYTITVYDGCTISSNDVSAMAIAQTFLPGYIGLGQSGNTVTVSSFQQNLILFSYNSSTRKCSVPTTITPANDVLIPVQKYILQTVGHNWLAEYDNIEIKLEVAVNNQNFPDTNFRNWVKSLSYGSDGILTKAEIAKVITINVSEKSISNLKGIEYFTALKRLECYENQLTSLDVSNFTALEELFCYKNKLTALNVSGCTALTVLWCHNNQLTSLNVSGSTALKNLSCYDNQLTTLDVTNNMALKNLSCYDNQLTALGLSKNTLLESLSCYRNKLTSLNVSGCTALTELYCVSNQLTALNLSNNTALKKLECSSNQLTALDLSKNMALIWLMCDNNQLTSLKVSTSATGLSSPKVPLYCYGNRLSGSSMDAFISSLPTKTESKGDLCVKYLDLSPDNEMTSAQVVAAAKKGWRTTIYHGNYRTYYPGSDAIAIDGTNFPDGNFCSYVLSNCDTDEDTYLSTPEIEAVAEIDVWNKSIANLKGIEYFTALRELYCTDNRLTALNVSKNTKLTKLLCANNQLAELNVLNNTALEYLDCHGNQLAELDLSKNTALEIIWCYGNKLTTLDVSNNKSLTRVGCYGNKISGAGMETLVSSLPKVNIGYLNVYNTDGTDGNVITTVQVQAAKDKYWNVLTSDNSDYSGVDPGIVINEENFPCEWFRTDVQFAYDTNEDGYLSTAEAEAVTVYMRNGVTNFKGIEYFTELEQLDAGESSATEIDLSKNTKLKWLSLQDGQLKKLDLSKNTALESVDCWNNQLEEINVSGCSELGSIRCYSNRLTGLDLSANPKMYYLECYDNLIQGKDLKLPTFTPTMPDEQGLLVFNNGPSDGNMLTKLQALLVRKQGWNVLTQNDDSSYDEYLGVGGDANGDGVIDEQDVNTLRDYILGLIDISSLSQYNADADSNGTMDIVDLTKLIKYLTK